MPDMLYVHVPKLMQSFLDGGSYVGVLRGILADFPEATYTTLPGSFTATSEDFTVEVTEDSLVLQVQGTAKWGEARVFRAVYTRFGDRIGLSITLNDEEKVLGNGLGIPRSLHYLIPLYDSSGYRFTRGFRDFLATFIRCSLLCKFVG